MKKLLVLLLILGMASTASAVLTAFEEGVELKPHTIPGTINIFGSGFIVADPGTVFALFTGTVDTETLIVTTIGTNASLTDLSAANSNFEAQLAGIGEGTVTLTESWRLVFEDTSDPFVIPNGNLASFNAGSGQTIWLLDSTATVILDKIPEPMTIALLGLGGFLFLRRRK